MYLLTGLVVVFIISPLSQTLLLVVFNTVVQCTDNDAGTPGVMMHSKQHVRWINLFS